MDTHTIIEILKTTSGAANPLAPSILTTIPPEIRNQIYDHLYKRDAPVLLLDGCAYGEGLRRRLRNRELIREHHGIENSIKDEDFHHGFGNCVGLLLSCRQVYHEAVGILYGQNIFLFAQFLSFQQGFAGKWLSSIGSHYKLLSRVHMEVDGFDDDGHSTEQQLLSLLKPIWKNPQAKCEIVFVLSERSLAERAHLGTGRYDPVPWINLLNNVFFRLGIKDALNLRRCAKFSRLVHSITIEKSAGASSFGHVHFFNSDTPPLSNYITRSFDISGHGSELGWRESPHSTLLDLPIEFLSAINAYVRASDARIVFDLDNEQAQGFYVGLSGVNRFFEYHVDTDRVQLYNEIEIRMSTQKATTDFNSFAALQRWLNIGRFASLINSRTWRAQKCSVNMVLMFRLPTTKPIEDLRINIVRLLDKLNCDDVDSFVIVQESDRSKRDTKPIMWHHLRRAVFLVLSDVLELYPFTADWDLPQIWINGHGNVLCAKYPASSRYEQITVSGVYTHDNATINLEQAYRKIRSTKEALASNVLPYHKLRGPPGEGSLSRFWKRLRSRVKVDWRSVNEDIES
jgi:hypothetical protein